MSYVRTGMGDIANVAATIQKIEGWSPGTVAYRNNNPGNLRYSTPILGAVGVDSSGFLIFPDYGTGYQALQHQIALDASRGLTIAQFTAKYAPAQDSNDPVSYAAQIAAAAGLSPGDPLSAALNGAQWADSVPQDASVGGFEGYSGWVWGGLLALGFAWLVSD